MLASLFGSIFTAGDDDDDREVDDEELIFDVEILFERLGNV